MTLPTVVEITPPPEAVTPDTFIDGLTAPARAGVDHRPRRDGQARRAAGERALTTGGRARAAAARRRARPALAHLEQNMTAARIALDDDDLAALDAVPRP